MAASVAAGSYMVVAEMVGWGVLAFFLVLSLVMALMQALEMVETIWRRRWTREALPAAEMIARQPADRRMAQGLAASRDLQRAAGDGDPDARIRWPALDYPDFEVIVIDNNTKDPAVWRPVQDYCAQLGERFRFFHFDVMKGFKAGALNYVLSQTAPDAKVIGVIDSDYMVRADWLKALVPYFDDRKIGYVQAPQDHRDWTGDRFKEMLNWEYAGFFDIGMCLRNEYDAIIQHGTMTLVRRDLMEEMGGWATWCITEDTELGLRLMEKGYGAMYSRERFGQGLTPDHFAGYKKQRFRWAYGAMQIMKAHAGKMLSNSTKLTFWQKYHFVAGWAAVVRRCAEPDLHLGGSRLAAGRAAAAAVRHQAGRPAAGRVHPADDRHLRLQAALFLRPLLRPREVHVPPERRRVAGRPGAHLHGGPRGDLRPGDQPAALHAHAQDGRARHARHGARHGARRGGARGPAVARARRCCGSTMASSIPRRGCGRFSWSCSRCPIAAAVYVSVVNALEQMRHARTVFEAAPAPRVGGPSMQPAQ